MGLDSIKTMPLNTAPNQGSPSQIQTPRLAVVTPARNEAAFIEETLRSVVAQIVRPVRWVIVSDGSTDGTDEIVMKYTAQHDWIELVRTPERKERHFGGKVFAFEAGRARLVGLQYDVIANLDADTTLPENCFEVLLKRFAENPRLGVAGVDRQERILHYDYRFTSIEDPNGGCQLFRRECFEEIGGFMPLKGGGVDLVADITARMKGWQTRIFPEIVCLHHRKTSSANRGLLNASFDGGRVDYLLGCDPLWHFCRSLYRVGTRHPVILDGVLGLAGYSWAVLCRAKKVLPPDVVRFRRLEERRRLRAFIGKTFGWKIVNE